MLVKAYQRQGSASSGIIKSLCLGSRSTLGNSMASPGFEIHLLAMVLEYVSLSGPDIFPWALGDLNSTPKCPTDNSSWLVQTELLISSRPQSPSIFSISQMVVPSNKRLKSKPIDHAWFYPFPHHHIRSYHLYLWNASHKSLLLSIIPPTAPGQASIIPPWTALRDSCFLSFHTSELQISRQ